MKLKRSIAFILVVLLAFAACACAADTGAPAPTDAAATSAPTPNAEPAATTRTITDMLGREVEIPVTITSYGANSNEPQLLSYAGAVEGLMTTHRETDKEANLLHPGVADYQYVGFTDGGGTVDQEVLIEASPDIVLLRTNDPADERIAQIEACGIPVVCCFPPNAEGVMDFYRLAAEIFGGEIANSCNALIEKYNNALKIFDTYNKLPEETRVLIIWSMNNGTYRLQGNTAEVVEMTKRAGATMCYDETNYIEVDMEQVAAYDADVIINFRNKEVADTELLTSDVFKNTRAFKDGKFYTIMNTFNGMAPSSYPTIIMYMNWICSTLYGEKYTGPSMEQVIKDFNMEWYGYQTTDEEVAKMLAGEKVTVNAAQFVK